MNVGNRQKASGNRNAGEPLSPILSNYFGTIKKAPSKIQKGIFEIEKGPSKILKGIFEIEKGPSEGEKGPLKIQKGIFEIEKGPTKIQKAPSVLSLCR